MSLGSWSRPWVHAASAEDVDRHLDVNAKGVIHGSRAAAAVMVPRGRGHIVNVASLAAHCPVPGLSLYAASKFAVRGFSLAAAYELRPHGVAVSIVCPDTVRTPMAEGILGSPEAALAFSGPRLLTVEEVARVIVDRVPRRPIEVLVPAGRGWLARAVGLFPALGFALAGPLAARGRKRQAALRRVQNGSEVRLGQG